MLHEPWRIQLLSGLRLQQQATVVERFRTRKAAGLLAYLAFYARQQHSREELAELFWPDTALDARAKSHNLSQTLSTLRRYLEPTPDDKGCVLRGTHTHVSLNREAIVVDVAEFEAAASLAARATNAQERGRLLTRAVALYAGDLLPGSYEDWALRERERLRGVFAQTLLRLSEYAGSQGQYEQAIRHALRAAHTDPYNETAHEAVIRWQLESGQPQRALAHYREFEAYMGVELHGASSANLRALLQRIDGANAGTLPGVAPALPPAPIPTLSPPAPLSVSPPPARVFPLTDAAQPSVPLMYLPLTLTAFFGRETEIQQAGLLLESARLLTLTGPGGSGKTRLAIEIGRAQSARFDTVVFVSLADVGKPLDLLPAIGDALACALDQRETAPASASNANQDVLTQIETLLSHRHALLILDNFEHLVEAAQIVPELLANCPLLSCLATSRRPLRLSGERVLAVAPFPCPEDTLDLDELQTRPSIQLFVNRAQATRSDFRLTSHNASVLAGLCGDLDGLPLALELAAARIGTFTLSEMRRQLADGKQRFQLLVSRHRDAHHRHHSLTSALGWSYCQLIPAQQRFFARLSLLRGHSTVNAAHAVGGFADITATQDALDHLCSVSLITSSTGECETEEPAETTFHLLETMRQFGQQQLTPEEAEEAARHHAQFCLRLAESHSAGGTTETESAWLTLMEQAAPNLRAALDWCFSGSGDGGTGLRLCVALLNFWYSRCHYAEALRYFSLALDGEAGRQKQNLRADALHGAAIFASRLNHYEKAAAWARECLQWRREQGDARQLARCLQHLAHYVWCRYDFAAADAYHQEALALFETLEDWDGIACAYGGLGAIAENRGDVENAERWRYRQLGLARQHGDTPASVWALGSLSSLAAGQEQWAQAKTLAGEALTLCRTRRDEYQIAYARMWQARACLGLAEWEEAETHLQAATATLERLTDRSGLAGIHRLWAELAWKQGQPETARIHLQQCFALLLQLGEPLSVGKIAGQWIARTLHPADAPRLLPLLSALDAQQTVNSCRRFSLEQHYWNACLEKAKATMGAKAFQRAWDKGRKMQWSEALGMVLTL